MNSDGKQIRLKIRNEKMLNNLTLKREPFVLIGENVTDIICKNQNAKKMSA